MAPLWPHTKFGRTQTQGYGPTHMCTVFPVLLLVTITFLTLQRDEKSFDGIKQLVKATYQHVNVRSHALHCPGCSNLLAITDLRFSTFDFPVWQKQETGIIRWQWVKFSLKSCCIKFVRFPNQADISSPSRDLLGTCLSILGLFFGTNKGTYSGNISISNVVHAEVNLDFLSRFEGGQT